MLQVNIDNRTDTFSYDDVQEAIDRLDGCIEPCPPDCSGCELDGSEACPPDCDIDEHVERASLQALLDQVSSSDSYFVRDSYFVQYARELADDIVPYAGVPRWPFNCIDWQEAADELQQDYYDVDFDGVTYWVKGG